MAEPWNQRHAYSEMDCALGKPPPSPQPLPSREGKYFNHASAVISSPDFHQDKLRENRGRAGMTNAKVQMNVKTVKFQIVFFELDLNFGF